MCAEGDNTKKGMYTFFVFSVNGFNLYVYLPKRDLHLDPQLFLDKSSIPVKDPKLLKVIFGKRLP